MLILPHPMEAYKLTNQYMYQLKLMYTFFGILIYKLEELKIELR